MRRRASNGVKEINMSGFICLRTVACVLAVTIVLATGCSVQVDVKKPRPSVVTKPVPAAPAKLLPPLVRAPATKADVASVAEGNNAFAFDLYAKLKTEEGNLIFSPYSISTALAMTYAGARGETAAEMKKTLRFALSQEKLHPAMADLVDDLNARGGKDAYELVVANRLWGQAGYSFLAPFIALNRTYYGAGLEQVNFKTATEAARKTINTWVEDKTRDKIQELLKPGILTDLTRLVLTNAIYFKGNWASQFKKERTADAPFHVTPDKSVDVPTMRQTAKFGYTETQDMQVLEMPYIGDDLSMTILLPKKADGLGKVEASLSAATLKTWVARLRKQKVGVFLPRFKMEFSVGLVDTLEAMGMPRAFDPSRADFSGMDGTRALSITAVIHKAFVDVNEEGTEAAAATAVVMGLRSAPSRPIIFNADRPFIFLIRDRVTGSVLFIGRVTDPSA
jgi:serpin B